MCETSSSSLLLFSSLYIYICMYVCICVFTKVRSETKRCLEKKRSGIKYKNKIKIKIKNIYKKLPKMWWGGGCVYIYIYIYILLFVFPPFKKNGDITNFNKALRRGGKGNFKNPNSLNSSDLCLGCLFLPVSDQGGGKGG